MNIMQQNDHLLPSAAAFFSARLLAQCVPSQKSQVEPLRTSALWRPENQPHQDGDQKKCVYKFTQIPLVFSFQLMFFQI